MNGAWRRLRRLLRSLPRRYVSRSRATDTTTCAAMPRMNPTVIKFIVHTRMRSVPHRLHEVVLAVGEDRRERGGDVAENEVAAGGEVLRQVLQRLLEGDPAGGDLAGGVAGLDHRHPL